MKRTLTILEYDLLALMANNLFQKSLPLSDNPDWDMIYQEAMAVSYTHLRAHET